ncbi:hypothetical protein SLEP1_g58263 [Rubroshorea leprosula]|uniref:Uncharacterized protein n=1 Tax=Rubroshorea leprosula TaxID=152421 RepID=A0AAV5MTB0_9ROSI|nr:hypothetical protein SLEP1_g58263 [Rubroshorea leprosula]
MGLRMNLKYTDFKPFKYLGLTSYKDPFNFQQSRR